jgi:hypothetical protein
VFSGVVISSNTFCPVKVSENLFFREIFSKALKNNKLVGYDARQNQKPEPQPLKEALEAGPFGIATLKRCPDMNLEFLPSL